MPTLDLTQRIKIEDLNFELKSNNHQRSMTGTHVKSGIMNVGTTEESISFGDVVPGLVVLRNHDDANAVQVGVATGVYPLEAPASGESGEKGPYQAFFVPSTTTTLYVKAVTAACDLEFYLIDA